MLHPDGVNHAHGEHREFALQTPAVAVFDPAAPRDSLILLAGGTTLTIAPLTGGRVTSDEGVLSLLCRAGARLCALPLAQDFLEAVRILPEELWEALAGEGRSRP